MNLGFRRNQHPAQTGHSVARDGRGRATCTRSGKKSPDRESEGPQQPPRVLPTAPNPGPTPSVKAARCERVEQSVGWGFKDGELFGELRLRATCRLLHTVATRRQRILGASPVGWGSAHAATHFDSLPSLRAAAARPERGPPLS